MRFDVRAELDHLYMLNFSVDARRLSRLVPPPLRVLQRRGRGLTSVVLPSIKRMRPALTRFPAVDYEMCGVRVLVEHHGAAGRTTKGVYFARMIIDPGWVARLAALMTPFSAEPGQIVKRAVGVDGAPAPVTPADFSVRQRCEISVRRGESEFLRADVRVEPEQVRQPLPAGSVFADAEQAIETYNDIRNGFVLSRGGGLDILQIASASHRQETWPLEPLTVNEAWVQPLHDDPLFAGTPITVEPSYFTGAVPRYWRWLQTERVEEHATARARVTGDEPAQ